MQDTQVAEREENRQKQLRPKETTLKTRFNDAEYERWCQNLRSKGRAKGK